MKRKSSTELTLDKEEDKNPQIIESNQQKKLNLDDSLTCPICRDILTTPVSVVPCLHTFCGSCLSECATKSHHCPSCRKNMKSASVNHTIASLIETYLDDNPEKKLSTEELEERKNLNKISTANPMVFKDTEYDSEFDDEDNDDDDDDIFPISSSM
ncbi:hypothetical protein HDU92_001363 [Lobulomyces angularis]|nr:hypothetical protein HDU92_001363 [Lobulomyces angularis]